MESAAFFSFERLKPKKRFAQQNTFFTLAQQAGNAVLRSKTPISSIFVFILVIMVPNYLPLYFVNTLIFTCGEFCVGTKLLTPFGESTKLVTPFGAKVPNYLPLSGQRYQISYPFRGEGTKLVTPFGAKVPNYLPLSGQRYQISYPFRGEKYQITYPFRGYFSYE
ncbi:MAG: hypothetical protein LBK18_08865 [Prevotellaceae bacterium]|nr:hypothetical protein [Prevotellaceae bacterium]